MANSMCAVVKQALVLLRELHLLMGSVGMYFRLFAGLKAMSENTVNAALRRLGYTSAR